MEKGGFCQALLDDSSSGGEEGAAPPPGTSGTQARLGVNIVSATKHTQMTQLSFVKLVI